MTDPPYGCWPLDTSCDTRAWEDAGEEAKVVATIFAVDSLRRLTLGRVGGCPVTIRPLPARARRRNPYQSAEAWMVPFQTPDGGFGNYLDPAAVCAPGCEIPMPGFVGRIDSINIGGVEQDLADFRVDDVETDYVLVYQGTGTCPFPVQPDMRAALGQPGTFSVTYLPAHIPDEAAQAAAGALAVEFVKACAGQDCSLPKNVTAVTRQGVTQKFVDGMFPNGLTNIKTTDAFILLWNPNRIKVAPSVWSPDLEVARVTIWQGA